MKATEDCTEGTREDDTVVLSLSGTPYFTGTIEEAKTLLKVFEPYMKTRGNFLVSCGPGVLRSYYVKDAVRVLRKLLA